MRLLRKGSRLDRWRRSLRRKWRSLGRPPGPIEQELARFARDRSRVCFVQIGSNDGRTGDPLYRLATRHGWSGVLVEPVHYLVERLRRNYRRHPGIRIEHAAIADTSGVRDFWYLNPEHAHYRWYDQIGSFDREHVVGWVRKYESDPERLVVSAPVPCLTFSELIAKHGLERVDLIHIDAEGYDGVILRSIDLARVRPDVVLFEHHHMPEAERKACTALLEQNGYALIVQGLDTLAISAARRRELGAATF